MTESWAIKRLYDHVGSRSGSQEWTAPHDTRASAVHRPGDRAHEPSQPLELVVVRSTGEFAQLNTRPVPARHDDARPSPPGSPEDV